MILSANPEFMRNVWLELTPQRLLAMPALIGLILLITAVGDPTVIYVSHVALVVHVAVFVLWGAKLAGDSMSEELVQGTWDSQRLSGLGAWPMTVGKLFGGPVFAWYGGLFCMGTFLIVAPPEDDYPTVRIALIATGIGITAHALALLSNLTAWRKLPRAVPARRSQGAMLLLAFLVVPQLLMLLTSRRELPDVVWYGRSFAAVDFTLLCTGLAVFWAVLGLYRAMREELSFRDPPVVWIAFLVFIFAFIGGWFHGSPEFVEGDIGSPLVAHLGVCALVALFATYALLFGERKDWVRLRRIVALWRAGEALRAFELIPQWLVTLALTALVAAAFAVATLVTKAAMQGIADACVAFGFLAFLVRDGALVLGLNFTRDQRRADSAAALYLGVLYILLPALAAALGLTFLFPVFWPPLIHQQPVWLVLVLPQAAAALDFTRRRWGQLPAAG